MTEKIIRELTEKIEEKAYIPVDWVGVSEIKVVKLDDIINILNEYKPKYNKLYW